MEGHGTKFLLSNTGTSLVVQGLRLCTPSAGDMEQVLAPPPPHPPEVSSACLLSVGNFSQRKNLIREVRNGEEKETIKGD